MNTIRYLDFQCPIRLVSEANLREHYMVKHKRKKEQQMIMAVAMHTNLRGRKVELPCTVTITRIGAKALDADNLANSAKNVQDEIARQLGIDDGDTANVKWVYSQMPIKIREYAVKVSIESCMNGELNSL